MIYYEISIQNPLSFYFQVKTVVNVSSLESISLQLAAWRPGRYELQNFAQKIQHFQIIDPENKPVRYKKITKDRWDVFTQNIAQITVLYNFYAHQMDAGGSWVDETQLYVNPVNCLMAVVGQETGACELKLNVPETWEIACGLPQKDKNILTASNYEQLVDCPLIASDSLKHAAYEVNNIPFHVWLQGNCAPNWEQIIANFKAFSEEQVKLFGDFPVPDYHFLNQILPYNHYHGVEHSNSTVIALGPGELLMTKAVYKELIGVSSHELFHTWNIKQIRPQEMIPYDYTRENYFRTGYVAEGLTTYYGDYILGRAGVFTTEEYFQELNGVLSKHFNDYGHLYYSIADSSFDLWLDGYKSGIPNRKVSIYHKGALAALILDLKIRKNTNNEKSLDTVMQRLWLEFGKPQIGYTEKDYERICNEVANTDLTPYFSEIIYGSAPIQEYLKETLEFIGCTLLTEENTLPSESIFGFKTSLKNDGQQITAIAPESPAYYHLSLEDELIAVDNQKIEGNIANLLAGKSKVKITLFRNKELKQVNLNATENRYYQKYIIRKAGSVSDAQKINFYHWMKQAF